MKSLALAIDLSLPLDVVRQRLAFLGRTGSGKTYAAMKLAELMLDAGMQVIVLDTVGVWPGLRTGPKPFSIPVFGGAHGDMQLLPTHGALLGKWLAEKRSSAVLDISHMIAEEVHRFGADFAEAFFLASKRFPHPVHIILEECQDLVPESARTKLSDLCCKRWERIQKQGRNFEIGLSLISQRPQDVAKTVLNQTECLFAFQMTGHTERKAISRWVSQDIDRRLPSLDVGYCFVWSPQWLRIEQWTCILPKQTPELSQLKRSNGKARALSEIDLGQLRDQLSTVAEETKLTDPEQLRDALNAANQRIAKLEQETYLTVTAPKEFAALKAADRKLFERLESQISGDIGALGDLYDNLNELHDTFRDRVTTLKDRTAALQQLVSSLQDVLRGPEPRQPYPLEVETRKALPEVPGQWTSPPPADTDSVGGAKRKILIALAQFPAGLTRKRLAAITGFAANAGYFKNNIYALRTAEYISGDNSGFKITPSGRKELGAYQPLPTGKALREYWIAKVGATPGKILRVLCEKYPSCMTRDQIATAVGLEPNAGYFKNSFYKVRALELITGTKEICAAAELFD